MRSAGIGVSDCQSAARLVVVLVDGRPQTLGIEPEVLRAQLPRPGDRFLLEVVAEGEVAEHLEERQVGLVADLLDVGRPEGLLGARRPRVRRVLGPQEEGPELDHPRRREQQVRRPAGGIRDDDG